jgi:hypothetical protein
MVAVGGEMARGGVQQSMSVRTRLSSRPPFVARNQKQSDASEAGEKTQGVTS